MRSANATEALAVTDSIPMLSVLTYALWRRRIEPLGASAAALAAIALLLTIAPGGSPLPLELHHAVLPGTVGLACLLSLAVRRPLLSLALARLVNRSRDVAAERRPKVDAFIAQRADDADRGHRRHSAHRCRRLTGGGSGIGRELVCPLATHWCSVAACDWNADTVAETAALAKKAAAEDVLVSSHVCDVADAPQVQGFRDQLLKRHATHHVDLVFSNASIGEGASFVAGSREEWERTLAVDWWGVYYCARTFLRY